MERGALMPEYRVEWSIEAETDDLEAAALPCARDPTKRPSRNEPRLQCRGQDDPNHPIDAIDASDPNNLVLVVDGGQRFTVRVIAGA